MCKTVFRLMMAFLLVTLIILPVSAKRMPPQHSAADDEPIIAADAPMVATYFYYWYDYPSKAHILNPNGTDALLEHPPRFDGTFSYENDHWLLGEFEDMVEAGIDVVLPVYRGHGKYPTCEPWSRIGLEHMVRVLDKMSSTGQEYPKVGMFYDTTSLQYDPDHGFNELYRTDLTTGEGRETFFLTVKSFFDSIPSQYWAVMDGKPIVWLYKSEFAKEFDESFFGSFKSMFFDNYGVEPYLVAERSWEGAGEPDAMYRWGAAKRGSDIGQDVIGVGPGFNDTTVPGSKPTIIDRMDSLLYELALLTALEEAPPIVVVETWNNLHEGTHICDTREQGREYIDITRYFVDALKWPEKYREVEAAELKELYYNTVTLPPAEVWEIDLKRGYVDFPAFVECGEQSMFGHLEWRAAGSDVAITPPEDDFTLQRREMLKLDYSIDKLETKTLMGPLPYLAGNFAVGGREMPITVRLFPMLIRRIDCYPYAGRDQINIDGDLTDWTGQQATFVTDISHAGGPAAPYPMENTGAGYPGWHPGDASMEIYTCWNDEYLYMAVVTRDDIPLDGQKGKDMIEGDCIQVAFELDDDRDGTIDTNLDIEFAMTEIAGADRFHTFRRPYGLAGPLDRLIRHAIARQGNMTIYEFAIPIIEFGIPQIDWDEEYTLGFNVVMHDDDGDGWEGFIQLAPGLTYGKDTRRFARIVLVEE